MLVAVECSVMLTMDVLICSGVADDDTTATGAEEDCTVTLLMLEFAVLVVDGVGEGLVT